MRGFVEPTGPMHVVHVRVWSTVARVPTTRGTVWFKVCQAVQRFEPYLSQQLSLRWPDRVAEVLAIDQERAWLLLGDAGESVRERRIRSPAVWLQVLAAYAELQRGEAAHTADYLAHDVPDLRIAALPARFTELAQRPELPLNRTELRQLQAFQPRFAALCSELDAHGIPSSVQHDDLHQSNIYLGRGQARVLDWGDSCIGHPFMSLVETFRFVEDERWHPRLRDAYLEPWGPGHLEAFELAITVGGFAHCIAWLRQRDALPEQARAAFDEGYAIILRRALARAEANWPA